jgi:hypothetical protein
MDRMVNCRLVWVLESRNLSKSIEGFDATDQVLTTWWTCNNILKIGSPTQTPCCCLLRLGEGVWYHVVVLSWEHFTDGTVGVDCQCLFPTSSRTVISVSASALFHMRVILKRMECHNDLFETWPCSQLSQWNNKCGRSICLDITLLRLPERSVPAKTSVTLACGERIFRVYSQDPVCTFYTLAVITSSPDPQSE